MEWILLVVLVIGGAFALAIYLTVRVHRLKRQLHELADRVTRLEAGAAQPKEQPAPIPPPRLETPPVSALPGPPPAESFEPARAEKPTPPSLIIPPPLAASAPTPELVATQAAAKGKSNWEQFVGVKLFAWLGGFALFLGVVFFVKYAFDHNLIPPVARVALGFLVGIGLVVGGIWMQRQPQYRVTAQTLCATGVVILYATTYAGRSFYHLLGTTPAFLLMGLITATAFGLSVRFSARVVAILGLCGGFLTPVLLATGQDNPLSLFGYIALLDLGLLAVALRKRWDSLTFMGAVGTMLVEVGWVDAFFVSRQYFVGNKVLIALAVFVAFSALFVAAWAWGQQNQERHHWLTAAVIALSATALLFGFYLLSFKSLGERPGIVFGYVFLIDVGLLLLAWREPRLAGLQLAAGAAVFSLLAVWTVEFMTQEVLNWGLGLYFGFALLHAALPFVLDRMRPGVAPVWWGHLFPPVALLLMLVPIGNLHSVSWTLWAFALLVNLLVVGLVLLSASALWLVLALLLTVLAATSWINQMPAQMSLLPAQLGVVSGLALFFVIAGVFVAKRLATQSPKAAGTSPDPLSRLLVPTHISPELIRPQVPALSAALPYLLLLLASARLPLVDPTPVFAVGLLLAALLLGLTRLFPLSWLPAVALGCVLDLEVAWHFEHFRADAPLIPLLWYLGFTLLFTGFPFLFWRRFTTRVVPWAAAALAGPLHFYLVYRLVKAAWPNPYMGLLPAAFALPAIAGLAFLVRSLEKDAPKRMTLLAWFGGATLFFLTLIFPIQFERQWITLGWALEGVALLGLFYRVPHGGLRVTGVGLLVIAFFRLALNPAVLVYHARGTVPIFNWYLYAYGIVIACLFVGVRLLARPPQRVLGGNARALLGTLGAVLAFLLLNLEIADAFTAPGTPRLTFQFSGNFGRDMAYSIGWAVFALGLVGMGIGKRIRAVRFAGIGLLGVTLVKLFLHDLASLEALYRIVAFIGVAIIAMAASFLYQRFLGADLKAGTARAPVIER